MANHPASGEAQHKNTPSKSGFSVDHYVQASNRKNTQRCYRSSIEHFEVTWGGFLPATADQIAQYLANYADQLSMTTLSQRLAALATWHKEQGFPDPTKASLIKKVLKGIRELHPATQHSARPLQIDQLKQLVDWMDQQIIEAERTRDQQQLMTQTRNRAMVLIGFWRGFRSDELCRMTVEHTQAEPNRIITIFLPRSKGDRDNTGRTYQTPALAQLCPVNAYLHWIEISGLKEGAAFQGINRWGQLSGKPLHTNSIIPMLRGWLENAGIPANTFTSHSLRRGFATWANANEWDIKELMQYVGWKDLKSALRYIEVKAPFQELLATPTSHSPKDI